MRKNRTKRKDLKCVVCQELATHSVITEIRTHPGPPLKRQVGHLCCDNHAKNTNIDYWYDYKEWLALHESFRKKGFLIQKQYSNIHMEKLD